jgi:hypothetical protein
MLSEQSKVDKIEISEGMIVSVRERTDVFRDGVLLSASYKRWTLAPGQNTSGQTEAVQKVCAALWTDDVIEQYRQSNA